MLTRRQALAGAGSVTLGALLSACGGGDSGPGGAATVPTTDGATATVETRAPASAAAKADALLEDGAACALEAEQAEGPFYFDADAIRSDIREDRAGVVLRLAVRVREVGSCRPLPDAVVDVWHCDAGGVYSGFDDGEGERFLRGAQMTDAAGVARFTTVYPGWYSGRTPHVHLKVHLDRRTVLTTQLYFDEKTSAKVYDRAPYRPGRDQTDAADGLFDPRLVLALRADGAEVLGAMTIDVRA